MNRTLNRLRQIILQAEDLLLVGLVFFSIILSCLQILLRNLFDSGILWADSALRVLVLWLGMLGAMYASRCNRHIRIDLVSRFISEKLRRRLWLLTELFSAAVCMLAAWYSSVFTYYEYLDGTLAFAAVPSWFCILVIPVTFTVMGLRFVLSVVLTAEGNIR